MSKLIFFASIILIASCAKRDPNDKLCPECKRSDEVIPIVYGLPDEGTFTAADWGKVMLGGCVVSDDDPNWYCKRDNKSF